MRQNRTSSRSAASAVGGRTGTVLAGLDRDTDPVAWVRSSYCEHAIETDEQIALVRSIRREL